MVFGFESIKYSAIKNETPFKKMGFVFSKLKIYKIESFTISFPQLKIKVVRLTYIYFFEMNLIGRTSMLAFVFMTASYVVTGHIIPGVV